MWKRALLAIAIVQFSSVAWAAPADEEKGDSFIRITTVQETGEPVALQTPIITLRNGEGGATVTLVGAVHIADRSYYRDLNERFTTFDSVLYELVAEDGQKPGDGGESSLHFIQSAIGNALALSHQLDVVDYDAENFVHADLSPTQLSEEMAKGGDTMDTLLIDHMLQSTRLQNRKAYEEAQLAEEDDEGGAADEEADADEVELNEEEIDLGAILTSPGGSKQLKLFLAEGLAQAEIEEVLGGAIGHYLIGSRNQAACDVLRKQLAAGKAKIGIFYGAGHIPDFLAKLKDQFGLEVVNTEWVTAINLTTAPDKSPAELVVEGAVEGIVRDALRDPNVREMVERVLEETEE